ncbi:MAG: DUF535 family protein [Desulfuromonadaceae bacterium]|nr:DUF535 family protein [Desulfuromonadaceae bacterium]
MHSHFYMIFLLTTTSFFLYILARSTYWRAAKTGWKIAAACYTNNITYQKLRWALASAMQSIVSHIWFNRLDENFLQPFLINNPRLALKPVRVYMSTRWKITQKVKVIIDTYQFIWLRGGFLHNSLLQSNGDVLARTCLGKYGHATILLSYNNQFRKEGELVLSLWVGALTRAVAFLSFSLERHPDGSYICYVGCLQGSKEGHQKENVITASKAMHGLRPKAALVFTIQEIARAFGAKKLLGVGSSIQAHRRKHLLHIPFLHDYTFNYDATWIDAGGVPDTDGWFRLPLKTHRHSHEEIKSNKRSMYLRRYAMMDDFAQQISSLLHVQDV